MNSLLIITLILFFILTVLLVIDIKKRIEVDSMMIFSILAFIHRRYGYTILEIQKMYEEYAKKDINFFGRKDEN